MPLTADLTIRETAALSGVPRTVVEKAVETRVMNPIAGPAASGAVPCATFPFARSSISTR